MDCSENSHRELIKCKKFISKNSWRNVNILFIKRRNWNLNHGAQLDYIRLLAGGKIGIPQYSFFMQDHYLNKKNIIKSDTIPDNKVIDLNSIEKIFLKSKKMVLFCSRFGFRISTSVPNIKEFLATDYGKYNLADHKGSVDCSFVVDGGNFCVDPSYYLNHYKKNKKLYTQGNGNYDFCHVWETRLCKILYDQKLMFYDYNHNFGFRTIALLKERYPRQGNIWHYFHHFPTAYVLYGGDIYKYSIWRVINGLLRYGLFLNWIINIIYQNIYYRRDKRLEILRV